MTILVGLVVVDTDRQVEPWPKVVFGGGVKLADVGTGRVALLVALDFEVVDDVKGMGGKDEVPLFRRCVTAVNVVDSGVDIKSEDVECSIVEVGEYLVKFIEGVEEFSILDGLSVVVPFLTSSVEAVVPELNVGYTVDLAVMDDEDDSETRDAVPSEENCDVVDIPIELLVDSDVITEEETVYDGVSVLKEEFKRLVDVDLVNIFIVGEVN